MWVFAFEDDTWLCEGGLASYYTFIAVFDFQVELLVQVSNGLNLLLLVELLGGLGVDGLVHLGRS